MLNVVESYIFIFQSGNLQYLHSILDILPSMTCHSPRESLEVLSGETIEGIIFSWPGRSPGRAIELP